MWSRLHTVVNGIAARTRTPCLYRARCWTRFMATLQGTEDADYEVSVLLQINFVIDPPRLILSPIPNDKLIRTHTAKTHYYAHPCFCVLFTTVQRAIQIFCTFVSLSVQCRHSMDYKPTRQCWPRSDSEVTPIRHPNRPECTSI